MVIISRLTKRLRKKNFGCQFILRELRNNLYLYLKQNLECWLSVVVLFVRKCQEKKKMLA